MQHFAIEPNKRINVELKGVAALLKPTIYIDGKYYCCLLGMDPETGIFGRGRTLDKALDSWDKELQKHLKANSDDDYIIAYVRTILNKDKKPKDVKAFYDQFKL